MRAATILLVATLMTVAWLAPAASAEPYQLCTVNKEFIEKGPVEEASVDPSDPEDPVTVRTRPLCWW